MVRAEIQIQNSGGPEGYFMPNFTSKGRLLLIPGIVDFDETKLTAKFSS